MRYKVGDKVKVREWGNMVEQYGTDEDGDIDCDLCFLTDMKKYCGKEMTISKVDFLHYRMEEDHGKFIWSDDMLCEP